MSCKHLVAQGEHFSRHRDRRGWKDGMGVKDWGRVEEGGNGSAQALDRFRPSSALKGPIKCIGLQQDRPTSSEPPPERLQRENLANALAREIFWLSLSVDVPVSPSHTHGLQ
jgi:hypothetical protein